MKVRAHAALSSKDVYFTLERGRVSSVRPGRR
jgi:hypothetical protein